MTPRELSTRADAHQRARIFRDAATRWRFHGLTSPSAHRYQAAAKRQEAIGNGEGVSGHNLLKVPWYWDRHDTVDAIFGSQIDFG